MALILLGCTVGRYEKYSQDICVWVKFRIIAFIAVYI